ncbi:hypothetical protein AOC05_00265 [Arthrobacter alpinus]|uniref:Uncharacterized protein n=1 Tax=Arthrobacter alpinus TaxID=656366 RepID=A0A0M3UFK4_9MICC|nr:hypothetical protein AOC05_00265 [Arthrobacter alpinus]
MQIEYSYLADAIKLILCIFTEQGLHSELLRSGDYMLQIQWQPRCSRAVKIEFNPQKIVRIHANMDWFMQTSTSTQVQISECSVQLRLRQAGTPNSSKNESIIILASSPETNVVTITLGPISLRICFKRYCFNGLESGL